MGWFNHQVETHFFKAFFWGYNNPIAEVPFCFFLGASHSLRSETVCLGEEETVKR